MPNDPLLCSYLKLSHYPEAVCVYKSVCLESVYKLVGFSLGRSRTKTALPLVKTWNVCAWSFL